MSSGRGTGTRALRPHRSRCAPALAQPARRAALPSRPHHVGTPLLRSCARLAPPRTSRGGRQSIGLCQVRDRPTLCLAAQRPGRRRRRQDPIEEGRQAVKVGIPREVKTHEYRVAITPAGVHELVSAGHQVYVEKDAGVGSAIPDEDFVAAGAQILGTADDVWSEAELVLQVKEPIAEEYGRMRRGQVLFTYLHLAASRECTEAILSSGIDAVAYETVQTADLALPLLAPMSEVAGRLASQVGAYHLMRQGGGRGVLMGGVSGVYAAKVVVIGAVLVPGAKAPRLVTNELVSRMKPGSVLVDISIDQGGCFEDSRPTTHADPVYKIHNSLFYCVANMPGAVPNTSTHALTNVTMPYALELADRGWRDALRADRSLALGLNTHDGHLTYGPVAEAHDLEALTLDEVLA